MTARPKLRGEARPLTFQSDNENYILLIIKNKNICVGVQLRDAAEEISLPCTQLLLHEVTGAASRFPKTVF